MSPIKAALVGVGTAGQVFHAPMMLALPELFTLHTVVERNPKSARGTIGDKFDVDVKVVRTLEEALEDKDIDLIVVATPTYTHFELAKVRSCIDTPVRIYSNVLHV
jgi:predicted dehydrogenase